MNTAGKSLIAAAILAFASAAQAVVLTPGSSSALPGTTSAAEPQLAGLILEDVSQAFSFAANGGTISGTVQSRVVRSIDGTLDFYWRVMSARDSAGNIGSFRLGGFLTDTYNANWRSDGSGTTAPEAAHLFPQAGGFVNFNFDGGMPPFEESYFMFLDTDATTYAMNAVYDLTNVGQNEISGIYSTFAPATVPEPGSVALLGLGMAGLALTRRRRLI